MGDKDMVETDPSVSVVRGGPDMRTGPGPELLSAESLSGTDVYNTEGEAIGEVKTIMLDTRSGHVGYVVLSFKTFFSVTEKLFAVPWEALALDSKNKRFVINVDKNRLKAAPGFDKHHWPDMADQTWQQEVRSYYESTEH